MKKTLFSTNAVGMVIDTTEWMLGISYSYFFPEPGIFDNGGSLVKIGFLCFIIYIAKEGRKK